MSEFDELDDVGEPSAEDALGAVAARVRARRARRRVAIGSISAGLAAVVIIATAVSASSGHAPRAVRTADATSTPSTDTGVTDSSTTPNTDATTTTVEPPATDSSTAATTTTVPHDPRDYSMLVVDYGPDPLGIVSGATKDVTYTVTNTGSWDVDWLADPCPVTLWGGMTDAASSPWLPYPQVWPEPWPVRGATPCSAFAAIVHLPAGASQQFSEPVLAGYTDAAGNVMPAPPGWTSFAAPFVRDCAQPCDYNATNSLSVTVYPPDWPAPSSLYTMDVASTDLRAASGDATDEQVTYSNPLAFTVRIAIYGPCWTLAQPAAGVSIDCSGAIPTVAVPANTTVHLTGKVYARTGFVSSGAPLAPGRYPVSIGDRLAEKGIPDKVFLTVS